MRSIIDYGIFLKEYTVFFVFFCQQIMIVSFLYSGIIEFKITKRFVILA